MGSEHAFESEPDLSRCCASDNIGQNIFSQGRNQSTEDHLILNQPGMIIGIGLRRGDLCSSDGENLRRSRPRTIQESKEMLATEVGDDLGFPKQVILAI